ncbi:MAG: hypothetical protein GY826_01470 [Fuerstiella sp.]|nr:hypothetical protein [Fuerstiella sp.]
MLSTSTPAWAVVDPIPVLDARALGRLTEERPIARSNKSLADLVDESNRPATILPLDDQYHIQNNVVQAFTRDVSDTEAEFTCGDLITARHIRIQFTTQNGKNVDAVARVRHCTSDGQNYHVGVSIVKNGASPTIEKPATIEMPARA